MIVIYLLFIALIAYAIRLYMKRDEKPELWDLRKDMYYKEDPFSSGVSFDVWHQNYAPNLDNWD